MELRTGTLILVRGRGCSTRFGRGSFDLRKSLQRTVSRLTGSNSAILPCKTHGRLVEQTTLAIAMSLVSNCQLWHVAPPTRRYSQSKHVISRSRAKLRLRGRVRGRLFELTYVE
jgi:hypothetical protein